MEVFHVERANSDAGSGRGAGLLSGSTGLGAIRGGTGARRGLDRSLVRQLATCRWVAEHHNVLITGPTGVGKTYLACALAQQACRQGARTVYRIDSPYPVVTRTTGCAGASFSWWTWSAAPLAA